MILADNETRVDLLNNEAIASTTIKLLRDQDAQPVTGVGCRQAQLSRNDHDPETVDDHRLPSKVA
jgi:hypothetical protein